MLNIGVRRVMIGYLKDMVSIVKSRILDSCRIYCSTKEQMESDEWHCVMYRVSFVNISKAVPLVPKEEVTPSRRLKTPSEHPAENLMLLLLRAPQYCVSG